VYCFIFLHLLFLTTTRISSREYFLFSIHSCTIYLSLISVIVDVCSCQAYKYATQAIRCLTLKYSSPVELEWVNHLIPAGNESTLKYRALFMHFRGIDIMCPRSPIVVALDTATYLSSGFSVSYVRSPRWITIL
jgi:hypothetical protein